ncbi:hypothetical protein LTR84_008160 [Exophiala bonariae]|uniref:Enoyl reductase (ER) domain-containing protein n=1 Tax=Exophiala bonariae TaxID=1690606 RepID=A0AAV9NM46_9EURO|nr:hypothetical protein LTR84_008160 [Exophiala bonariae]
MKGVIVTEVGAQPTVVDNLTKPVPAPDQVLVKSIWAAINPVDNYMVDWGILVVEWPFVLGCDAAGVVVEAGEEASSRYGLTPGTEVFGCTRLGHQQYSTAQEFFLMDAAVTLRKPKNISLVEAATLGVGSETAMLALVEGLKVSFGNPKQDQDEWIVVLGGASSVGKCAIQLARAAGYKVAASCSSKSADEVKALGAATFDYKQPLEAQVQEVLEMTSGKFSKVFDAVAADDPLIAKALFRVTNSPDKRFATTNDWSGIGDFEGGKSYLTQLGAVGRPEATELNKRIASYVPVIIGAIERGDLKPADYEVIGNGLEAMITACKHQKSGAGGSRKVVIKIQDE